MTRLTYFPAYVADTEDGSATYQCAKVDCNNTTPCRRGVCDACESQASCVRHGYTLQDIHDLARQSVVTDRFRLRIHMEERMDAAVCAITVLLYTAAERPQRSDLLYAGSHASIRVVLDEMHHHGINRDRGGSLRQQYVRYWEPAAGDSLEDRVIDRVSLEQIWSQLGPGQREARPVDPAWIRALRDECQQAGVPFLFKQWGGRTAKAGGREIDGRTWDEYPAVTL